MLGEFKCGAFRKVSIGLYNFQPKNTIFEADDVLLINYHEGLEDFSRWNPWRNSIDCEEAA